MSTSLESSDRVLGTVRELNQKLAYENRHYTCVLKVKTADIRHLQRDILAARVTATSGPGNVGDREQALQGEITLLQKNIEDLKEELTDMTEDRNTWRDKYWTMLTSLDEAHRLINVNLHNAARFKEECRQAEESRDETAIKLNNVERELMGVTKQLDDIQQQHEHALLEWEEMKSTLEAGLETMRHELECEMARWEDLHDKHTIAERDIEIFKAEIDVLQAELNKDKAEYASQTDLCLLCMVSRGVQAITDTLSQEAQTTPPELVLRAVQTINAATCSSSTQMDTPRQPETANSHSQTSALETGNVAMQTEPPQACKVVLANSVDPDEPAHDEPSHQDLHFLQAVLDDSSCTAYVHVTGRSIQQSDMTVPHTDTGSNVDRKSNVDSELEYISIPVDSTDQHRQMEMENSLGHRQTNVADSDLSPTVICLEDRISTQHQMTGDGGRCQTTGVTNLGRRKHFKFTAGEKSQPEKPLNQIQLDAIGEDEYIKPSSDTSYTLEDDIEFTEGLKGPDLRKNREEITDTPRSIVTESMFIQNNNTIVRSNIGLSVKSLKLNKKAYLTRPVDIDPTEYSITLSQAHREACCDTGHSAVIVQGAGDARMETIDAMNHYINDKIDNVMENQGLCQNDVGPYKAVTATTIQGVSQSDLNASSDGTDHLIGQDDICDDLIGPSQPLRVGLSLYHSQTSGFKHKLSVDYSETSTGLLESIPLNSEVDQLDGKCTKSKQPKLSELASHLICVPQRVNVPGQHTALAVEPSTTGDNILPVGDRDISPIMGISPHTSSGAPTGNSLTATSSTATGMDPAVAATCTLPCSLPVPTTLPGIPMSATLPGIPMSATLPGIPMSATLPGIPMSATLPGIPMAATLPGIPISATLPDSLPVPTTLPGIPMSATLPGIPMSATLPDSLPVAAASASSYPAGVPCTTTDHSVPCATTTSKPTATASIDSSNPAGSSTDVSGPSCSISAVGSTGPPTDVCSTHDGSITATSVASTITSRTSTVDKDSDKSSFLQKYRDMVAKLKPGPTQFQTAASVQSPQPSVKSRSGAATRRSGKTLSTNSATQFVPEPVPVVTSPHRENPRGILKRQSVRDKSKCVSWLQK